MRLLILFLFTTHLYAGELFVQWTNADANANGVPFIPGEFVSTRVVYSQKQSGGFTHEVTGDSVRISGVRRGWWDVYLQTVSKCHHVFAGASVDFLTVEECVSEPTPTLRVKVR